MPSFDALIPISSGFACLPAGRQAQDDYEASAYDSMNGKNDVDENSIK
jgi:hypothetical protein